MMTYMKASACWLLIVFGTGTAGQPQIGPVVEPEDLVAELRPAADSAERPLLLDVRPAEKFVAGHVKGAVHLDVAEWARQAKTADQGLDHPETWRRRISELGIGADSRVVVYDAGPMTEAARVWFILQYFGVRRAAVLNGGYAALEPLLTPETTATGPAAGPPAEAPPAPAGGAPAVGLLDKSGVKHRLARPDTVVLDVRTENEYLGEDKRGNPRVGHLPGAVNLPHGRLLDERSRLKPPAALRELFAAAGLKPGQRLVAHCQSGGRSSLAALAAVRAGFTDVSNYYLSFADWSADEACPVSSGAATTTSPTEGP